MRIALRELVGTRICQYLAAVTSTLGMISSEMHFGWSSPSLPLLTSGDYKIQLQQTAASWLAVTFLAGNITGAILSSVLLDRFGRKNMLLATTLPYFVSWVMIGAADVPELLFMARFIGGIASGISYSVVPMYLGEISEPSIRGTISSICPIFVVLGILSINILGNYLPLDLTAYIASTIPLLMFITFIWMPESPIYLNKKQDHIGTLNSLIVLRGRVNGEKEFERLKTVECNDEDTNQSGCESIFEIFKVKHYQKALMISMGLRTVQQFCGSTVITFYCKELFNEAKEFLNPNVGTIIFFSIQALVAISSSYLFDIFGRRLLLLISLFGTILSLFSISTFLYIKSVVGAIDLENYEFLPITLLFINVIFFSVGVRNTPMVVMSEIFPTKIKSKALCLVTIYYGFLGIATTKFFNLTKNSMGLYFSFAIFGVLSFIDYVLVYLYLPETKGKTLEEIQELLKDNVKR